MSTESLLHAVEEQRSRLLNVLGGIQCVKLAVRHEDDSLTELEGALDLLQDEVQRAITSLEASQLERSAPQS